jgi:hypothetical protein
MELYVTCQVIDVRRPHMSFRSIDPTRQDGQHIVAWLKGPSLEVV